MAFKGQVLPLLLIILKTIEFVDAKGANAGGSKGGFANEARRTFPKQQFGSKHMVLLEDSSLKPMVFINPELKFGSSNYGFRGAGIFPGYFEAGSGKDGLFATGGQRNYFKLTRGPGFLGGGDPALGSMEVYHRHRVYQAIDSYLKGENVVYKDKYGYGPLGKTFKEDCFQGCPDSIAFCDLGMCRCRNGYDAIYGYCYKSESKYMEHTRAYLAKGGDPSEVQYNCNAGDANMCHKYDINMVCHTSGGSSRCKCRDGTKWNWETKECQVYMDVDCSKAQLTAPQNTTIPSYSTKILSDIFPSQTMANSKLMDTNLDDSSTELLRGDFCREIDAISQYYDAKHAASVEVDPLSAVGTTLGLVISVTLLTLVVGCSSVFCIVKRCKECSNKSNPEGTATENGKH